MVHKCLQFVETFGLEVEGIYRMSGNQSKIRKLILGFNQGQSGTGYNVAYDVALVSFYFLRLS